MARLAARFSDALKIATKLRATKNDAGYYLNWVASDWKGPPWTRAYALPGRNLPELPDLNTPREKTPLVFLGEEHAQRSILWNAGWHFSYMGGVNAILSKMRAYSHDEPEVQRWADAESLPSETDLHRHFVNGSKLMPVTIDASFPTYVQAQADRLEVGVLIKNTRPSPG